MKVNKILIIAEAGVNHNGSIEIAKKLINIADDAGADYVKFQTFKAETLVTKGAEKAEYQKKKTSFNESQHEMIEKLELNINDHQSLIEYCQLKKIKFLSSPFDDNSVDLLDELDIPLFKIPSGEITNLPYLRHIASKQKPIIISTGMSNLDEVSDALDIFLSAGIKKEDITILHCNTEYPTPFEDVNMNAMLTIKKEFDVNIGYSDHTLGIEVPILAASLGATVIEKHFTLDKNMKGPDHAASLNPTELTQMVKSIRNVEKAFGNGIKVPSKSEIPNIVIARKSIVAKIDIEKNEILSLDNLATKRPATGISPMNWDQIIGKKAKRKFLKDELIEI